MSRLFVGATNESLSDAAKKFDNNAVLILPDNINGIAEIQTGYISIGDHQFSDFYKALSEFDELIYVTTDNWEHETTKEQTERWLRYFSHQKPVQNIKNAAASKYLSLKDNRKSESAQCWIVGDDIAAGVGIEPYERFGEIVADKLNCRVSYLVDSGVSVDWCADQILRSNIKENDVIIWMLPNIKNMTYYDSQLQKTIELSYRQSHRLDVRDVNAKDLQTSTLIHSAVSAIQKVINISKSIKYKLLISTAPVNESDVEFKILDYLVEQKEFVHVYGESENYLDLNFGGTGDRPGPLQHKLYADIFLSKLK